MDTFTARVAEHYDRQLQRPLINALLEGSRYFNYGYWHDGAISLQEAGDRLMRELVDRAEVPSGARILDVACGMGATTRYLADNTPAAAVVGINISQGQLAVCRATSPDLTFHEMSAIDMTFDDATFDTVFCVEAAFHFKTRRRFLEEARRVLRAGGRIVLTDMPNASSAPLENILSSRDDYTALLEATGFRPLHLVDRTEECIDGMVEFLAFFRDTMMQRGRLGPRVAQRFNARMESIARQTYWEVSAEAV